MDYRVIYRVGDEIPKTIVLRNIEKITYDSAVGPKYRAFWADRAWLKKVAEFDEVLAVLPTPSSKYVEWY
jgi:hypothetical protein